jgi:hypothetical protein
MRSPPDVSPPCRSLSGKFYAAVEKLQIMVRRACDRDPMRSTCCSCIRTATSAPEIAQKFSRQRVTLKKLSYKGTGDAVEEFASTRRELEGEKTK